MEEYAAPFTDLIDREPFDLTPDERESLEFYYASINIAEGLPVDSAPRRWCLMAHNVVRVAHMLGRLPQAGDPGATPEILAWIAEQRAASLNAFQRAWLGALPRVLGVV